VTRLFLQPIPWVQQSFWQKDSCHHPTIQEETRYGVCFCQIRKCNGHKRFSDSAFQAAGFGKGIYYGDRTGDDEVYDVLSQAVELTIKACSIARGGEVFVLKMPVIRLKDLAEVIIEDMCKKNNIDPKR